ncbi:hypothetical protein L1987_52831 [Smallanthus sonchifolius]|uniref:Uncharacterized protein n=1 Tax=Smallanthus sonchifolius TaxID=185202 RepID=A0ACB9EVE7_9ASTR|nr:hypothetical protein L1987_52831 [Smallanthus sonchifolius]
MPAPSEPLTASSRFFLFIIRFLLSLAGFALNQPKTHRYPKLIWQRINGMARFSDALDTWSDLVIPRKRAYCCGDFSTDVKATDWITWVQMEEWLLKGSLGLDGDWIDDTYPDDKSGRQPYTCFEKGVIHYVKDANRIVRDAASKDHIA